MVKSYTRFEQNGVFNLISSNSQAVYLPGGSAGHVAVGGCGEVVIWDFKTGELVVRLIDASQAAKVQALQLTYEKSSHILACGYSDGSIRVWDLQSRTCLITFNGHKTAVSALKFDGSGTRLISGSFDTHIVVWDLIEEVGVCRLRGHKGQITSLSLVNDSWLIATSKDGIVKLWDLDAQFAVESHVAHKGECWGSAIQGDKFVTASNGTELKLWAVDLSLPEGQRLKLTGAMDKQSRHRTNALYFGQAFLFCASGDCAQIWRLRSESELKKTLKRKAKRREKKSGSENDDMEEAVELTMSDIFIQYALIRAKARVVGLDVKDDTELVLNLSNNLIESWRVKEEPERSHIVELPGHRTDVRDLCLSSDNKLVASGSNGMLKLHNARSKRVLRTLEGTGYIICLRFLPGDALVVAGTKEGNIDLYDVSNSLLLKSFPAHDGSVWSMDVGSDGRTLVSGGSDKLVKFWDLRVVQEEVPGHPDLTVPTMTLKNTHKLEFTDEVLSVKLSPNMKLVAASLLDNTIKVYYRDTLKFFLNLYGHHLPVLSMDISSDSKLLVSSSADKNIKIWGLDFGDVHKSIFAHDDSILKVVFEPQTHNFFSCSKDALVKYWDGDKFRQIQKLHGHQSEVWTLAVASDGSFIVTASHDKSIRVWDQTDEPLFVEEERELEMEQNYEEALADSLDRDLAAEKDAQAAEDTGEAVSHHTVESLKVGERLYEALQIAAKDLEEKPAQRHIILASLDVTPERYLMDVLAKIKSSMVEDALLTFPLESISALFKFIIIWLQKKWNLSLVCRVLFFCLRSFHRQIVANKMMQETLEVIRDTLRTNLTDSTDTIGHNIAYLTYLKDIWDMNHVRNYDDMTLEQTRKREFPAIGT